MIGQEPGRIDYARAVDQDGVEILRVDGCARRWSLFHETYTFCSVNSATASAPWMYRRRQHELAPGMVSVMEPGETHFNTRITPPATFRVLFVRPTVLRAAAEEIGMGARFPHFRIAQAMHADLFAAANGVHSSQESESTPLERQSRMVAFLRLVLEHGAETSPPPLDVTPSRTVVARAREFIHEHWAERITLDDLVGAAAAGSRFNLIRWFTAEVGLPPHAYQIHLRVTRARAMLAGRKPPAVVAAALGFADQSHFTRHFHRICGITPGQYRQCVAPRQ